jgi:hypothetical protein
MEFEVAVRALLGTFGDPSGKQQTVVVNGNTFRLPTSRDLAEAARDGDSAKAAMRLLETCHIAGHADGWTAEDLEAVGERLAKADPAAELHLELACPVCGEVREESLDPLSFLWSELQAVARRLLLEIHTLASAYGWTEREILSLGELRRSLYLQMVRP